MLAETTTLANGTINKTMNDSLRNSKMRIQRSSRNTLKLSVPKPSFPLENDQFPDDISNSTYIPKTVKLARRQSSIGSETSTASLRFTAPPVLTRRSSLTMQSSTLTNAFLSSTPRTSPTSVSDSMRDYMNDSNRKTEKLMRRSSIMGTGTYSASSKPTGLSISRRSSLTMLSNSNETSVADLRDSLYLHNKTPEKRPRRQSMIGTGVSSVSSSPSLRCTGPPLSRGSSLSLQLPTASSSVSDSLRDYITNNHHDKKAEKKLRHRSSFENDQSSIASSSSSIISTGTSVSRKSRVSSVSNTSWMAKSKIRRNGKKLLVTKSLLTEKNKDAQIDLISDCDMSNSELTQSPVPTQIVIRQLPTEIEIPAVSPIISSNSLVNSKATRQKPKSGNHNIIAIIKVQALVRGHHVRKEYNSSDSFEHMILQKYQKRLEDIEKQRQKELREIKLNKLRIMRDLDITDASIKKQKMIINMNVKEIQTLQEDRAMLKEMNKRLLKEKSKIRRNSSYSSSSSCSTLQEYMLSVGEIQKISKQIKNITRKHLKETETKTRLKVCIDQIVKKLRSNVQQKRRNSRSKIMYRSTTM